MKTALLCILLLLVALALALELRALQPDAEKWRNFETVLEEDDWDSCGITKDGGTYCINKVNI